MKPPVFVPKHGHYDDRGCYVPSAYEARLLSTAHPRSALTKQARARRGRAMGWFSVELEPIPEPVDDETTQPY